MDELEVLADLRARYGAVFRRRPGVVYVGEPATAKEVLANDCSRYREHSDFFQTSKGVFGSRSTQEEIGRVTRNLLRDHWARRSAVSLDPVSHWPDAGNLLLYQCFRDVLARGDLHGLVDQVVRHAVLAGTRDRRPPLSRAMLRTQVRRTLVAELSRRRARAATTPADVLDVLAAAAPSGTSYASLAQLSEVFLSCVYSVTGSLGFLLGWSVYLLGTAEDRTADPAGVVREALRLWPVNWHFGRSPTEPHDLGEVPVTPVDEVVVCAYLVHRDERYWPDPDAFRPQRWADGIPAGGTEAFIPFGWGPHACVAGSFAVQVIEDILRLLPPADQWHIEPHQDRPHIAAALAPPDFTLRLP
jgi:cytochrome P450